ncbi:TapY2 family type IVa secretion system protein [Aeromonas popoffii]|uniref:TapY2 family type IVa secretion system protein n=1 Tax=Aeromonas popoffii TaxID=70856 RepID=A0ABS5GQN5_9GAMM|nr:TapY2 family type IVa secretion system protein [Aeromonas popoffii]MBR7629189.1 TapY2 family type IVa secretion system protein [Aeromonas popoffii]
MNAVYGLFVLHLSFSVMAADIKCYVELDNGKKVVLQSPVKGSNQSEIYLNFKKKGFEYNGKISKVKEVLECVAVSSPFSLDAALHQEKIQPR